MEITYLGYTSFSLKNKKGMVVLINPFDPDFVGLKMGKQKADVILVSEDDKGHNYVKSVTAPVKREKTFVIDSPGEYEVGGIEISMIQINGGKERKKSKVMVIVVRMEGLIICHLGNLEKMPKEEVKKRVGTVDVLLTSVGKEGYLNVGDRGSLVKEMSPSIVIPMEYKTSDLKEGVGSLPTLEEFLEKNNMKVVENGVGKIKVDKNKLPEDMQVVVLNVGN